MDTKKTGKYFLIMLFLFTIFSLSKISILADSPPNQGNYKRSPYCCDGNDGNGKPRARTDKGEYDNYDETCSGSSSNECGGSGRYVGRPPYYPNAPWCKQVLEHEKGYKVPSGSENMYACNPVYFVWRPIAVCNPCTPQCPVPLVSTEPVNPPRPVAEYYFENIGSCDRTGDGCSSPPPKDYISCYEQLSPQPSVSLIKYPENVKTTLGFTSQTHTGGGQYEDVNGVKTDDSVNDFYPYSTTRNPSEGNLFHMEATFTDQDLPIEAVYVWFNKSGTKPITPMSIDLNNDSTPQKYGSKTKGEFGFMLHNKAGVWTPYIPAIAGTGEGSSDLWKQALNEYSETVDGKTVISIPGPTGIIAKVLLYSINPSNNGKTVKLKFSLSFKANNNNLLANIAEEGEYKIWLMANDTFGFTPYDNYEDREEVVKNAIKNRWITNERIRYYDQWQNTSVVWNLNFYPPAIALTVKPSSSSPSGIELAWSFNHSGDGLPDEFSDLILNIYKSEGLTIDPVSLSNINNGGASSMDLNNGLQLKEEGNHDDLVGSLEASVNEYLLKIHGGNGNGSALLTLNNVGQGSLYFYLTAFDKGGNIGSRNALNLDLRDWLITQGGLLYSDEIKVNVDNRGDLDAWLDSKDLLKNIAREEADISTELIGKSGNTPVAPSRSGATKSYMIRPFLFSDPPDGYYTSLKSSFNRRKGTIAHTLKDLGSVTSLSGNLSGLDGGVEPDQIAVGDTVGTLTVSSSFKCDRQGIFFVDGDLTIDGRILNTNVQKDACIFIASGNVTIKAGNKMSTSQLQYDEINMYLLSDGQISIKKDDEGDGLYISGGIHTIKEATDAIRMERTLRVADRLRYPAVVVNHHSKYGVLARSLFGIPVNMQETEVGITPY